MNKLLLKATALSIALFGAIGVQTFTSCSGDDGSDGAPGLQGEPGAAGVTPTCNVTTGTWYSGTTDTGISCVGSGTNGITPECKDGFWYNGTVKTETSCTAGAPGENCTNADKGEYIEITCGTNKVQIPKAMCGAVAYDPGKKLCDARDGKMYKLATIGTQVWMAENLNYITPTSKCYGDDTANCTKYGRLYDYATALTACPTGLHLPTNEEFEALVEFAGGEEIAGKKLKAATDWLDYVIDGDPDAKSGKGTDDFGFTALPGGYYYTPDVDFFNIGTKGYFRSVTKTDVANRSYVYIVSNNVDDTQLSDGGDVNFFSVRCIKD